jgi:hypothetical protein|tara:strand:- start:1018 stop:1629 length:612 start_codon:yes stop_codon:yes gene_type:complete
MNQNQDLNDLSKQIDEICDSDSDESLEGETEEIKQETEQEVNQEDPSTKVIPLETKPKKKRGPYNKKQTQVIYQVVDNSGNVLDRKTQSQIKPLTQAELKQQRFDDEAKEMSDKLGYIVRRLKSGKPVVKRVRTEAQIAATKLLVQRNKEKALLRKQDRTKQSKNDILEAVKQVARMPKSEVLKTVPIDIPIKSTPTVQSLLG